MCKENKKLLNYTYENVKVGEWYLGYNRLCKDLSARVANGKNKESQFAEWERHLKIKRCGNKILIEEIYEKPIPLENEDEEVIYYLEDGLMTSKGRDKTMLHFNVWSEEELENIRKGIHLVNLKKFRPEVIEMWDKVKNGCDIPERMDFHSYDIHWWTCSKCNYNFRMANKVFFSDYRSDNKYCPYCKSSKYAKKIFNILKEYNVDFEMEYFYKDLLGLGGQPLRFDFAIIEDGEVVKLIEYDGQYHDINEDVMIHDVKKNVYCMDNGIKLLRIHHTQNDFLESMLLDFLNVKKFEYMNEVREICSEYRHSILKIMTAKLKNEKAKENLKYSYINIKNKLNKQN